MKTRTHNDPMNSSLYYDASGNGWSFEGRWVLVEAAPITDDEADGHYSETQALAELGATDRDQMNFQAAA